MISANSDIFMECGSAHDWGITLDFQVDDGEAISVRYFKRSESAPDTYEIALQLDTDDAAPDASYARMVTPNEVEVHNASSDTQMLHDTGANWYHVVLRVPDTGHSDDYRLIHGGICWKTPPGAQV